MNNKIIMASKKKSNKKITKNTFLMQAFHFSYAGMCDMFICSSGNRYRVVTSGFKIEKDVVTFSKDTICIFPFEKLYYAISFFNDVTKTIVSSMDWYTPKYFDECFDNNYWNEEIFE